MGRRRMALSAILGLALLAGACAACGGRLLLGQHPWAVGVRGDLTADGMTLGVEAGGWFVGLSTFLDVGPLGDGDAGDADLR